jgi:hypothetical protein
MIDSEQRGTLKSRPVRDGKRHHYFGLSCITCRKQIAVFRSKARTPLEIVGANPSIQVTCTNCNARGLYAMIDLVAFQQL